MFMPFFTGNNHPFRSFARGLCGPADLSEAQRLWRLAADGGDALGAANGSTGGGAGAAAMSQLQRRKLEELMKEVLSILVDYLLVI